MTKNGEVLSEIYKDFVEKRNMYKIELDNYTAELEVLEKSIEYSSRIEDTSKLFSPRTSETVIDSIEDLKLKKETTERLLEECREKYNYYNNFYEKLKPVVEEETKPDINDIIYGTVNNEEEGFETSDLDSILDEDKDEDMEISYSLNLNYNIDDIKEKLSNIEHKVDTCLKIFDNDIDRTKTELKNIGRSINKLLKSLN